MTADPRSPAGWDPFALLGLDPVAELSDDDVRAAWRRVAAATHPDRPDGGNPRQFAAAAAAYTDLRTPFGRGEARAALIAREPGTITRIPGPRSRPARLPAGAAALGRAVRVLASRVRAGRPARLALRIAIAAAAVTVSLLAAWPRPAAPALVTGALTWLLLTARRDLAATAALPAAGRAAPGRDRTTE